MAIGTFDFFSDCLRRNTTFRIILPNEADAAKEEAEPMRLLVLLHGYCGNSGEWLWYSPVVEMAQKYHMCILLPTGENSFYLDGKATGRKYATHVGDELIRYVRKTFPLSDRREDTFIGGFSMGGYGAIHTALQFPETFSGVIALSSALIWKTAGSMQPEEDNGIANGEYYRLMFGEPDSQEAHSADIEKRILALEEEEGPIPSLYLACGEQDFLNAANREFAGFLKGHKVEFCYHEGEGDHNFGYWNQHLESGIRWLIKEAEMDEP